MAKSCLEDGCNNPRFGKGYCRNHQYKRTDKETKSLVRKKISPISNGLAEKLKLYRAVRDKYMAQHLNCEICDKPSNDLHHKAGRGKNLCNVITFMAVCRNCHIFIHNNPKKSRELLYLL